MREYQEISFRARLVKTKAGKEFKYDKVIIATGVNLDFDAIPGNRELMEAFGDFYSTLESAEKLWNTLWKMNDGRFVIAIADPIYKCPPGPLKGAFLSNELFVKRGLKEKVKVVLAVPFPHAYPAKSISDIIEPELEAKGIEVHTFFTVDSINTKEKRSTALKEKSLNTLFPQSSRRMKGQDMK